MTIYAKFWKREEDGALTARPVVFECTAAQGNDVKNGIGAGKVVLSQYDHFRYSPFSGPVSPHVQDGDVCVCWCDSPKDLPQHVTIFIVDSRNYRGEDYEVSGPDFKAELQDYFTIAPIGTATEVVTAARSLGQRCEDSHCDTTITLEAAYKVRGYTDSDGTGAGNSNVLLTVRTTAQPTDQFETTFADGTTFATTIKGVSDERKRIELEEPLPQAIAPGGKIVIRSFRIRVDDASDFVAGQPVRYTPMPDSGPGGGKVGHSTGVFYIDRIEELENESYDYIYTADAIQDNIARGSTLTQFQYTLPTQHDVELLLNFSTGGEWSVLRGPDATNATTYTPSNETVWDVLLALADISGYSFRYRFSPWAPSETQFKPKRELEYWNTETPSANSMDVIGVQNRLDFGYGEALTVETASTTEVVTHIVPSGAGGLMFHQVPGVRYGDILADYPDLEWGVVNHKSFVYNKALDIHPVWREESFPHIAPVVTPSGNGRRAAAEQLLRTACDWLMEHAISDTTYRVGCYTLSEPRPGDRVALQWDGETPTSFILENNLIITEVEHKISAETGGLRMTTLTLNKSGRVYRAGPDLVAGELLNIRRTLRHGNLGAAGGAAVNYFGIQATDDFRIVSNRGAVILRSDTGDVQVQALGDVFIDGANVQISAPVSIDGGLTISGGVTFAGEDGENVTQDMIILRGIPRPIYSVGEGGE